MSGGEWVPYTGLLTVVVLDLALGAAWGFIAGVLFSRRGR